MTSSEVEIFIPLSHARREGFFMQQWSRKVSKDNLFICIQCLCFHITQMHIQMPLSQELSTSKVIFFSIFSYILGQDQCLLLKEWYRSQDTLRNYLVQNTGQKASYFGVSSAWKIHSKTNNLQNMFLNPIIHLYNWIERKEYSTEKLNEKRY